MIKEVYTVGELKKRVAEATNNEFKPVFGKNVESDNKKNNDDYYKSVKNRTKDYDGGAKSKVAHTWPNDDNRGMSDYEYDNNPSKEWKDNQKSRLKGYTSAENEKLHSKEEKGNYENNEMDGIEDKAKAFAKGRSTASEIGLTGRETNKKGIEDQHKTMFENKLTKIKFKNTTFLTEGHMISRIPDNYRVEGKKFIMEDKMNNQYIVEWHVDDDPKIINKTKAIQEQRRIKNLFKYERGTSMTNGNLRLTEDKKVNDMLNKARKLMY